MRNKTYPCAPKVRHCVRQADALFRKAKARALIKDLHFHDTRREALTRLAKKFDVMELARISGHRDLRILQNVYYAPTVEDLAKKLD
jgi:integrase